MTPDELIATLSPLVADFNTTPYGIHRAKVARQILDAWPDIAACLERLAETEAKWDQAVKENEMLVAEVASMESEREQVQEFLVLRDVLIEAVTRRSQP